MDYPASEALDYPEMTPSKSSEYRQIWPATCENLVRLQPDAIASSGDTAPILSTLGSAVKQLPDRHSFMERTVFVKGVNVFQVYRRESPGGHLGLFALRLPMA